MIREEHVSLRGGKGKITMYTTALKKWIFFGRVSEVKKAIRLEFEPHASVGWHQHTVDNEIYLTFCKSIRFNQKKNWMPINVCIKGDSHCAENIGDKSAKVYALKF